MLTLTHLASHFLSRFGQSFMFTLYAVTEQNFNEEWNKKGGSNDLLREQFIITLLVLLFLGGKNCEINFWACDPEKIVNCRINFREFAENLWICRNYFSEKSKRLYFDNQTLLTLDDSLIPSAEFIFTFHSWNKPPTPDTLSSSVNNSEKKFPGFINCRINFCNSTSYSVILWD